MRLQIFWQYKGLAFVSPSPIEYHHDIVVRIAQRHLIQKDLHALGIDMRKHEAIEASIHRTDCTIGIGIGDISPNLDPLSIRGNAGAPGFQYWMTIARFSH